MAVLTPPELSTAEVRTTFLRYFIDRDHTHVTSSALVPSNDPTLLFTNAGMVQFKDVFTGKEKRDYTRATSSQKCVRAGGKHNDLENVGRTPRHHTFFEMLGNFSFGDYFKADAIKYAWEFLTEVVKLPSHLLVVTVFEGEDGIPADDEAANLWVEVGVPKERVFRLGKSENYWQMGDTGPQGPCSEIHYWMGDGEPKLDRQAVAESIGWIEVWNLVFMQFVRETVDGELEPLPRPCVDTGAGLERLSMILQGKRSNYEMDLFQTILSRIAKAAGKPYGGTEGEDDVSMRVIADHARATAFLIADGVQPSSGKREYVLRRIMRRAIRHGKRLGFDDLFFHEVCGAVIDAMEAAYPELRKAESLIDMVVRGEETAFRRTLDGGMKLVMTAVDETPSGGALDPAVAGKLYDSHGFPIDLTRVVAEEHGRTLDEDAAHEWIKEKQGQGDGSAGISGEKTIEKRWFDLRDEAGPTRFVGYELDEADGRVVALFVDGARVSSAKVGAVVEIVVDRTAFYGESGGQVGDTGVLVGNGLRVAITDTQKPLPEITVLHGKVEEGELKVSDTVEGKVDTTERNRTRRNHSATHLLHLALKEVLGPHVQQKGSKVGPTTFRFDYSHASKLTPAEVKAIEQRVNEMVLGNEVTKTKVAGLEEAKSAGAVMLFGEKYADEVRMISIADSLELCGGTHVKQAGDIGLFKIVSDGPLASGIRRMEAVTGLNALAHVQTQEGVLNQAAAVVGAAPAELTERLEQMTKRNKELERSLQEAQTRLAMAGGSGAAAEDGPEMIGGVSVMFRSADGVSKKALRDVADRFRDKLEQGVVVLSAKEGPRATLLVAIKGVPNLNAGKLVKAGSEAMGGKGGGKPDFAQGGGEAAKLADGLEAVRSMIRGT